MFHNKKLGLFALCICLCACVHNNVGSLSSSSDFFTDAQFTIKDYYDGHSDDLASAGLGMDGLRGVAPLFHNTLKPSRHELRRSAIYHNYKALLSLSDQAGYGRLYADYWNKKNTLVSGFEYLTPLYFSDDQSIAAILMLQVPDTFNKHDPCIVVTASSGSRGIYGAAGVVGAWALHKGCAVVTTDKGTGTGFHWLSEKQSIGWLGELKKDASGAHFFPHHTSFDQDKYPHRIATKHAHSQRNLDQLWGAFVSESLVWAMALLNGNLSLDEALTPENTVILGAGISNGGAGILHAAEQGLSDVFDGVVVSEPAINLPDAYSYRVRENKNLQAHTSQYIADIAMEQALYLPCAALYHDKSGLAPIMLPQWQGRLAVRCSKLKEAGLLQENTEKAQSQEALNRLRGSGLMPESDTLSLAFTSGFIWEAYLVNYINAYGGFGIDDHLCGLSYAYTSPAGDPIKTPDFIKATIFSTSGGIVPTSGVSIMNDRSYPDPKSLMLSQDRQGNFDLAFHNLLCLKKQLESDGVRRGIRATEVSGHLGDFPTIVVHGRADNLIQAKNSARPYFALSHAHRKSEGITYYEVMHGQHFDGLVDLPFFKSNFVPLHAYFEQAMEIMFDALVTGAKIPPSQVVPSSPDSRGGSGLTTQMLPSISDNPHSGKIKWVDDAIVMD